MRVCKSWRREVCAHYLRRMTTVPPMPDALLRAVAHARPGDTLRLLPGVHLLSSELVLEFPLRLLSEVEAVRILAPCMAAANAPSRPGSPAKTTSALSKAPVAGAESASTGPPDLAYALERHLAITTPLSSTSLCSEPDSLVSPFSHAAGGDVVLVATMHVLLRSRSVANIAGITLCRMGDEVGYPNAVAYAEGGLLRMDRCRVTCGGAATSVPQALQAFRGAPVPGTVRTPDRVHASAGETGDPSDAASTDSRASTSSTGSESSPTPHLLAPSRGRSSQTLAPVAAASRSGFGGSSDTPRDAHMSPLPSMPGDTAGLLPIAPLAEERSQCPQSGVWVGAAASVELRGCTIAACMGPGVKIYRGRLLAQGNTIAFSYRGANVVANGGHVVLEGNDIRGANGDGISSWNNSVMCIEGNSIHGNTGAGIAVNTGGGSVTIANNAVFENACQAVLFATSSKQATLKDNTFDGATTKEGPPPPSRGMSPAGPPMPRRQ
mmetsp:Transcript_11084/g.28380  ORF Transcript_11084/g.28380 Transcript_11084/m.28380 type:complete len:494 (-) Transcript_11084:294-1775(-)